MIYARGFQGGLFPPYLYIPFLRDVRKMNTFEPGRFFFNLIDVFYMWQKNKPTIIFSPLSISPKLSMNKEYMYVYALTREHIYACHV